ncbi:hypothetical protein E0K84_18100, partial [Escherichia coli]
EGMKKTAPDGAVSGMPAIRETGPGKNLQAITVSTSRPYVGRIRRPRRIRRSAPGLRNLRIPNFTPLLTGTIYR